MSARGVGGAAAREQEAPTRPALRYHGGKWRLAPWIIEHFPPHRVYVEAFGGAASVLLRKPRAYAEVYNDLWDEVVALFRVLRDPATAAELERRLRLTPFARREFERAYVAPEEDIARGVGGAAARDIEMSRKLIIRSYMGFGSDGHNAAVKTGFRAVSHRSGTAPARDWAHFPDQIAALTARLQGVVIENRDAAAAMRQHDGPDTLHYVDPPYMPDTRSDKSRRGKLRYHAYTHEMDAGDHNALARVLRRLQGMVVLSGYPHPDYDIWFEDWWRVEREAMADGARARTEVLWLNPAAADALDAARAGAAQGCLLRSAGRAGAGAA